MRKPPKAKFAGDPLCTAAATLTDRRRKLRRLIDRANMRGFPLEDEQKIARALCIEIEALKVKIRNMGFDPSEAVRIAQTGKPHKPTPTTSKFLVRSRKKGGVGSYGLGRSLKVWS